MTILLFGVSNVGKSVTGNLLAKRLDYTFYDIDDEVKKKLGITLEEFVSTGTLHERDEIRCHIINSITHQKENKVIAVTPLSYIQSIRPLLSSPNIFSIVLTDTAENIFDRLVFSDENDRIYKDDDYKYKHMDHYLSEIREDIKWYGSVYSEIKNKFPMNGKTPGDVVDSLIKKYDLDEKDV